MKKKKEKMKRQFFFRAPSLVREEERGKNDA